MAAVLRSSRDAGGFHFYERIDVWRADRLWPYSREAAITGVIRGGAPQSRSDHQAAQEMGCDCEQVESAVPGIECEPGAALFPLYDDIVGDIRPASSCLLAAVGLVLLIASPTSLT